MIKRDKMETLLREIYSLKWWFGKSQNAYLIYKTKEEIDKVGDSPIGEIETLSKLYFPELEISVSSLSIHCSSYGLDILGCAQQNSGPKLVSSVPEVIKQKHHDLVSKIDNLATECRDIMANLESGKKNRR